MKKVGWRETEGERERESKNERKRERKKERGRKKKEEEPPTYNKNLHFRG